jgi:hypothetical protein
LPNVPAHAFLTGNYNGYAQTCGDPVVNQRHPNVGVYAQDEWRAGSNNVSPRAGFVWAPTASQDFLVQYYSFTVSIQTAGV